ncbi:MAG TPA: MEDS domain-containing protein [Actinomycetota bacterium]|nr:MEDS domain-containing protein [Actinomycetota bacterium]
MSRTVGPVPDTSGLGAGDHVCWVYADDEDHRAGVTRYFADGIERGERIVYVSDHYDEATVVAYLSAAGFAPKRMLEQGSLIVMPACESYPRDEHGYDLDATVAQFQAFAQQAVADGYTGFRVAGESDFLLETVPQHGLLAYELTADLMVREAPMTGMCLYDARHAPMERLGEVAAVHAAAVVASSLAADLPSFRLWASETETIGLAGEIDFATADTVRQILMDGAVGRAGVLDLTTLGFADVAAIRAIARVAQAMAGQNDRPVIRGAASQVRFVLSQFEVSSLVFDG